MARKPKTLTARQWSLVTDNEGLTRFCVGRFNKPGRDQVYSRDELLTIATDAIIDAARQFDPKRGIRFSTYACTAIMRRLSGDSRREARKLTRFTPSKLRPDQKIDHRTPEDHVATSEARDAIERAAAQVLTRDERLMVGMYFGCSGQPTGRNKQGGAALLGDIADIFGVTKECIRQTIERAMRKMRVAMGG